MGLHGPKTRVQILNILHNVLYNSVFGINLRELYKLLLFLVSFSSIGIVVSTAISLVSFVVKHLHHHH